MSQTKFLIENNIPIPKRHLQGRAGPLGDVISQTIDKLEIGQSFFIPDIEVRALTARLQNAKARNYADYTYRKEGEYGARVWRKPLPEHIHKRGAQ